MDFKKSRENALKMYWEAVEAANPYKCVLEFLSRKSDVLTVDNKRYNLNDIGSIYVVAFGRRNLHG
jgi:glycerate-2-kinase